LSFQTAKLAISKVTKIISAARFRPRKILQDLRRTFKFTWYKTLKSKIEGPYFELQRLEISKKHEKPVLNIPGSNPG